MFFKILLALMVQDDYTSVEILINKNEECLLRSMTVFNQYCDLNFHLKEFTKYLIEKNKVATNLTNFFTQDSSSARDSAKKIGQI